MQISLPLCHDVGILSLLDSNADTEQSGYSIQKDLCVKFNIQNFSGLDR